MKPRIQPYRASKHFCGYYKWRCVGRGRAGFGSTPREAYYDWKYRMNEGVKFKAQEGWDD